MALFESYERRIKINSVLNSYGIASMKRQKNHKRRFGLNVYDQIKRIQPICFENALSLHCSAAIAIKKDEKNLHTTLLLQSEKI